MSGDTLPDVVRAFADNHPRVWEAYNSLGEAVAAAGPLDAKTQRLIKLAIAVGASRRGAVRSHTRQALKLGVSPDELLQVALLAITTAGWPAAFSSYCWIDEVLRATGDEQ